jgi:hypothetical protein
MKKLICVLIFFLPGYFLEAQPYSSMSQEQLNFALVKAKNKINTGVALTFAGVVAEIAGVVVYSKGLKEVDDSELGTGEIWSGFSKATTGILVMFGGLGLMGSGIPIWAVGATKKNKIEIELVKFRPPGSASAYGVGLKIRF